MDYRIAARWNWVQGAFLIIWTVTGINPNIVILRTIFTILIGG
jgi:hypothetical protein